MVGESDYLHWVQDITRLLWSCLCWIASDARKSWQSWRSHQHGCCLVMRSLSHCIVSREKFATSLQLLYPCAEACHGIQATGDGRGG